MSKVKTDTFLLTKLQRDNIAAWSTIILAVLNAVLVLVTYWTLLEAKEASRKQIGVQTWLEMQKRFDAPEMLMARKKFAADLESFKRSPTNNVSGIVPDFFEDLGMLYEKKQIDTDLADESFSFYVCPYWEEAKEWILQQKIRYGYTNLYSEFEWVSGQMRGQGDKFDSASIAIFLDDEKSLEVYARTKDDGH